MWKIEKLPASINLGNQIENDTKIIQIDVSAWNALYPGCAYHITAMRPGDTGNWPVTGVTHTDGVLTWVVPNTVTSVPGQGSLVIHCTIDGKEKNTGTCWYFVGAGHDAMGEAPEPVADWIADATAKLDVVDHFIGETIEAAEAANTAAGLANEATLAANNAAGLANEATLAANNAAGLANEKAGLADGAATLANNAADRANTIAGTMEGIAPLWADAEISVTPLEPYETPTAAITQDENGTHFNLGIPDGRTYFATFEINYETGMLEMTTPDGYDGPVFTYNEDNGMLEVTI